MYFLAAALPFTRRAAVFFTLLDFFFRVFFLDFVIPLARFFDERLDIDLATPDALRSMVCTAGVC